MRCDRIAKTIKRMSPRKPYREFCSEIRNTLIHHNKGSPDFFLRQNKRKQF